MVMRIGGMASGLDTEQMVRDLMRAERMKVDRFFRQEETIKWRQNALNTTNKTLADFILKARSGFGLTRTTSTGSIFNQSTQSFDWVKKASVSNESVLKATASAGAMSGTHKIKVEQLAEVARFTSGDLKGVLNGNLRFDAGEGTSFTISTAVGSKKIELKNTEVTGSKVADLDFSDTNKLILSINGKKVELDEDFTVYGEDALNKLVDRIQDALGAPTESGITVDMDAEGKLKFTSIDHIIIESSDVGPDDNLKLETKLGLENGMKKGTNSINDVVSEINNAVDENGKSLGLRASYDTSLGKLMITTKEQGKEQFISISGDLAPKLIDSASVEAYKYNDTNLNNGNVKIKLDGNIITDLVLTDANEVVNYVNENLKDKFIAYKSGKDVIIKNIDGSNAKLEILVDDVPQDRELIIYSTGEDAKIKYNNELVEKSSNNFSIFGIDLQLYNIGEEVTINVDTNVDGMYDKVKAFVDDYNALIDNINGLINEKSYRGFQPLTKEEREAMKDKEIELWEEKAKSGLLRNDESLTRLLQTMRTSLYDSVHTGGTDIEKGDKLAGFNHITQIGITTGNYQSGGKLEIDEQKLRQAINDNPEGIVDLLFKTSNIKVPEGNTEEAKKVATNKKANSGLIERIFDDMINGMKDIVRRSGTGKEASLFRNVQSNMLIDFVTKQSSISLLDKELNDINKRIAREEMILMSREDRYWRQFTAMEKALEKMNQQSGWLMAQLGQSGR